jgi:stage V sporulation protein R
VSDRYDKPRNKYHYEISYYPDVIELATSFVAIYRQLYGRELVIKPAHNHFRIRASHRVAYQELSGICAFRSLDWNIPFSLLDTGEKRRVWLRAFFDCEAYVGKREIVVQSVNQTGLRDVQQLLEGIGILSRMYTYQRKQATWNTNYILVIGRRACRELYHKEIGFNHPMKQQKLENDLYGTMNDKVFKQAPVH